MVRDTAHSEAVTRGKLGHLKVPSYGVVTVLRPGQATFQPDSGCNQPLGCVESADTARYLELLKWASST